MAWLVRIVDVLLGLFVDRLDSEYDRERAEIEGREVAWREQQARAREAQAAAAREANAAGADADRRRRTADDIGDRLRHELASDHDPDTAAIAADIAEALHALDER